VYAVQNTEFKKGSTFASIESVKSANDVYLPVSGTVTETNKDLAEQVQLVNSNAESKGWMVKVRHGQIAAK